MRNPSIHITLSDLEKVLRDIPYTERMAANVFAKEILKLCQSYQIRDRYLQVLNAKAPVKKKMSKSMAADSKLEEGMLKKFNLMLNAIRQADNTNLKLRTIRSGTNQYTLLKEVALMAQDFSNHFEIKPVEDGYKYFIEIGLSMMKRYGLNKFKSYENKIYDNFESYVKVAQDSDPEVTKEIYEMWASCMAEYASVMDVTFVEKDDVKYAHFIYARDQAKEMKATVQDWVVAQFEGLAFMNVIPELYQLYGDGAKTRYERYRTSSLDVTEVDEQENLSDLYKNSEDE